MEVVFRKSAQKSISKVIAYIHAELQMPETAQSFSNRIRHFVFDELPTQITLNQFCSKQSWAKRELRCVVFEQKYVVAYKVLNEKLNVYHFVHGSKIKESKY